MSFCDESLRFIRSFYDKAMYQTGFCVNLIFRGLTLLTLLGVLSACTTTESLLPDRRPDYRKSRMISPLEVPPDLTASTIDDTLMVPELDPTGSASLSDYARERIGSSRLAAATETVLQEQPGIRLERDGNQRWLVMQAEPSQVWPKIKEFWINNGIPLKKEDPRIGIMETEWVENRADIPKGPIRSILSKAVDFAYSAPTRDKFRVRLERAADGEVTEVYLTHYGVQEVTRTEYGERIIWEPRPSDPELEAEMLSRLMVFLGASQRRAETQLAKADTEAKSPVQASRTRWLDLGEGLNALLIDEEYPRAWRLVGLALDSSNFVVENQDRAQGLYVVEYRELLEQQQDEGFLSSLAFWKEDRPPPEEGSRYQVRVGARDSQTLVMVYNIEGRPDSSPTAQHILKSVQEVIE